MSSAVKKMFPTPLWRAIISLVTMVMSASTTPVRQPTMISGNAAGSTMRRSRWDAESPMAAADQSIFSSTERAPWKL